MTHHKLRTFNPNENRGINIESIISAPLVAAANANAMMLKEQTKFLMDFCFTKKEDDVYDPVLIEMSLTKSVIEPGKNAGDPATIRKIQTNFKLPLLTMIPINSLAVDNVTVDFDMEIVSQTVVDADSSQDKSDHLASTEERAQLKGKISSDSSSKQSQSNKSHYSNQNTSKLKVHVNAGPLPLPVGINTILELYVKSILPKLPDESDKTDKTENKK